MSDIGKLNWKDFGKGLVVTVLSAVITYLYQVVQSGSFVVDWQVIGQVALSSGLGYILKNLLSDTEGKVLGKIQLKISQPG